MMHTLALGLLALLILMDGRMVLKLIAMIFDGPRPAFDSVMEGLQDSSRDARGFVVSVSFALLVFKLMAELMLVMTYVPNKDVAFGTVTLMLLLAIIGWANVGRVRESIVENDFEKYKINFTAWGIYSLLNRTFALLVMLLTLYYAIG